MKVGPIFDEWMDGQGDTVTTSVGACVGLAAADQLSLQVTFEGYTGSKFFTLTIYHSQDGFRWFPKYRDPSTGNAIPQLNFVAFQPGTLHVLSWGEVWPAPPSMRFLQIQIAYFGPGTRVMVYDTSRKRTVRRRSAKEECDACKASGDFPAHMRVLHDLGPGELAGLWRVIKAPASLSAGQRQLQLQGLGADTLGKLDRSLNAAALQILGGKD